jgi:hypothetical protein
LMVARQGQADAERMKAFAVQRSPHSDRL